MKLLFPCHPLKSRLPDPDYEFEVDAARRAGFTCEFYNLETLRSGDATGACANLDNADATNHDILHRGWMMSELLYTQLHSELARKGYNLIVTPEQYAEAHYLPNAYPHIAKETAESVWIEGKDIETAWATYQRLSDTPVLVKDFVKSAKHRWNEACFVPAKTSRERFDQIIHAFVQARGNEFNKGIVFRRYHELVTLQHDIRGQPVHEEYRMFFWKHDLLAATPALRGEGPFSEKAKWAEIARRFRSPFISMDVARQTDGSFLVVEVGDGGVSGLPPSIDADTFYRELRRRS